jgi:YD repeat-containing protein
MTSRVPECPLLKPSGTAPAIHPLHRLRSFGTRERQDNLQGITSLSSAYTGCNGENLSVGATKQNQINGDTYDAAGNLIVEPGPTNFSYDAENHLISTAGQTYNYDGDGNRVSKALNNAPTHPTKLYWYDATSDVIAETDGSGSLTNSSFSEYIYFTASKIARRDFQNNIFYYFADHLGSSRVLVQAGQTTACYESDFYPFGGERERRLLILAPKSIDLPARNVTPNPPSIISEPDITRPLLADSCLRMRVHICGVIPKL